MEQDRPELSQPGEAVVCTMLERLQNTMETSLTSLRTELSGLARQVGSPGRAATRVTVVSAIVQCQCRWGSARWSWSS